MHNKPMRGGFGFTLNRNDPKFIQYEINSLLFSRCILSNGPIMAELEFIEEHLEKNTWFAGESFSAADILIGFPMEAVAGRMATAENYPRIMSFVQRIRNRPAYVRAMRRGAWSVEDYDKYWACLKS